MKITALVENIKIRNLNRNTGFLFTLKPKNIKSAIVRAGKRIITLPQNCRIFLHVLRRNDIKNIKLPSSALRGVFIVICNFLTYLSQFYLFSLRWVRKAQSRAGYNRKEREE